MSDISNAPIEEKVAAIQQDYTQKTKQNFQLTKVMGSAGFIAGIIFSAIRRKGAWGYVAYTFLFTLVGSTLGTAISMARDSQPIE